MRKPGRKSYALEKFLQKYTNKLAQDQIKLDELMKDKEKNYTEIRRVNNIISAQKCRIDRRQRLDDAEKAIEFFDSKFETLTTILEKRLGTPAAQKYHDKIKARIDKFVSKSNSHETKETRLTDSLI